MNKQLVDLNTVYITTTGKKVRIYCLDGGGLLPVHGAVYDDNVKVPYWRPEIWTSMGFYNTNGIRHDDDLVEYNPYSSFKPDDPVFYQNCNGDFWRKGHFSHVKNGIPYVFKDGRTSFTSTGNTPSKPVASIKSVDES